MNNAGENVVDSRSTCSCGVVSWELERAVVVVADRRLAATNFISSDERKRFDYVETKSARKYTLGP